MRMDELEVDMVKISEKTQCVAGKILTKKSITRMKEDIISIEV
jgi:hypothetical protein